MPFNNMHQWFVTTYYYKLHCPELVMCVANKMAHYLCGAHQYFVRLVESQMVDSSMWWNNKQMAVGDELMLENGNMLDHVIFFNGPQPMQYLLLECSTTTSMLPFLKLGTYHLLSNRNLINTTFIVEFDFSCSVYAEELQPDNHMLLVVFTLVLNGFLIIMVALLLILNAMAAIVYKCT